MARMYEFVKQHALSVLARGELISSKPKEEANPRREASRILEELRGQPISDSVMSKGDSDCTLQPHAHAYVQPIISDSSDSVPGLLTRGDSRPLEPHPLVTNNLAEHRPRVFIRSRL